MSPGGVPTEMIRAVIGPTIDHPPRRPGWDCAACEQPWPCDPAREQLAVEYADDPAGLAIHMADRWVAALHDREDLRETGELRERMLGWLPDRPRVR